MAQNVHTGLDLRLPNGTPLKTRKRRTGGATRKRKVPREGRPIQRVAIPLRHSQAQGRDEREFAEDTFFAAQMDLQDCVRRCEAEGWEIVDGYLYLNYTGSELEERLEHLLVRMETGELDAIVVPYLSRFARTEEAHQVIARMKACGGHLISARENVSIYDPNHAGIIGFLIGQAAGQYEASRRTYEAIGEWKVDQGVTAAGHYGYEWVETAHDERLPDGTVEHYQRGRLKPVAAEFEFGREVYERLAAGQSPRKICKWLNNNGQRTRGRRRKDGTRLPGHKWTTSTLKKWARSVLNKGAVQRGDYIQEDKHAAMVSVALWELVQEKVKPGSNTSNSSKARTTRLLTGVLRCSGCRSVMSYDADTNNWRCNSGTNVDCPARANSRAHLIEPFIEERFLDAVRRRQAELTVTPAPTVDADRLASLEVELRQAQELVAKQYADLDTKETNRTRYDAACDEAERRLSVVRLAHQAASRQRERSASDESLLQRWPHMDPEERNEAIASTWPIIWLRKGEHIDPETGGLRKRKLADRVWPIPVDEANRWVVPRSGWVQGAERRALVQWWDGSPTMTKHERRRLRDLKADWGPKDELARLAQTEEEYDRWCKAKSDYKAHGRTDEEVQAGVARFGRSRAAARELGMSHPALFARLNRIAQAQGLVEEPVVIRARRRDYRRNGRTDEEILAALSLADGNYTHAARELGMPTGTLWKRAKRLQDPEYRRKRESARDQGPTDEEIQAAIARAGGNQARAARELGMRPNTLRYRARRLKEAAEYSAQREHYRLHGRTDYEIRAALARSGGNCAQAGRELGMPQVTVWKRAKSMDDAVEFAAQQEEYSLYGRTDEEIRAALVRSGANYAQAARELGMPERTVRKRVKALEL